MLHLDSLVSASRAFALLDLIGGHRRRLEGAGRRRGRAGPRAPARPRPGRRSRPPRASSTGWRRMPSYEAARTSPPSARQASTTRSIARGSSSGPSARTTTAASASAGSAASPQRSDAPGPSCQSGHVDALDVERVRTGHDDDAVDSASPDRVEHLRQEHLLLRRRRAVSRRRACCEDDGVDHRRSLASCSPRARPSAAARSRRTRATRCSARGRAARRRWGPRCTRRARDRCARSGRASA